MGKGGVGWVRVGMSGVGGVGKGKVGKTTGYRPTSRPTHPLIEWLRHD